jgi:hypothetical protein
MKDGGRKMNQLDYALQFAARGWSVFPIQKHTKDEYHVAHWSTESSNDPEQIKKWFANHECNFGLNCGLSRVGVLDIDDKGDMTGSQSFDMLNLEYGPIPTVVTIFTPHNGRQIYFSDPDGRLKNSISLHNRLGSGLDTRGVGGYVVAPGAIIKKNPKYGCGSGLGEYTMEGDITNLPVIPEYIIERVGAVRRKDQDRGEWVVEQDIQSNVEQAIQYLQHEAPEALSGARDDTCYKVACDLRSDFGISREMSKELMLDYYADKVELTEDFDLDDMLTKVDSADRSSQKKGGENTVQNDFEEIEDPWPQPTDLTLYIPPAPEFPLHAIPKTVGRYINDIVEQMQCRVDLIASPMIITLAGLIGRETVILPKKYDTGWKERACLWCMVIAGVGENKTTSFGRAMEPLKRIESTFAKEDAAEFKAWQFDNELAKERRKAFDTEWKKILKEKGSDAELPSIPEGIISQREEPQPRRMLVADATIEKLAMLMKGSPGLTLARDELAGFVLNMNKYHSAGSDRQFFLEAHGGGSYAVDRVGRDSLRIDDMSLNVVGGIQPPKANEIFAQNGSDDGLLERFAVMAYPEPMKGWELIDREPDAALKYKFDKLCDRLAEVEWGEILDIELDDGRPSVRFSDEAQEAFNEWLTQHMQNRPSSDDPLAGMYSKKRGFLVRLTLVLHLAAWAGNEETDPKLVSMKTLDRAIKLVESYYSPMWRRVYAAFGKSSAIDGAKRVLTWVKRTKAKKVTLREIRNKGWRGMKKDEEIRNALQPLITNHWIGPVEKKETTAKGGRPSEYYPVNPKIFEGKG